MYYFYLVSITILLTILVLLYKEEKKLKCSIIQGIVNKYWILKERRRFVRFRDELKIRYNLLKALPKNNHNGHTINISKSGLCITTYEKLNKKSILDIEVEMPDFPKPARLIGHVVWIKESFLGENKEKRVFQSGIKISKIDVDSEAMLLTHLNSLKNKSELWLR